MQKNLNSDNSLSKKAFREVFKKFDILEIKEEKVYPTKLPDWGPNPLRKMKLGLFNRDIDREQVDYYLTEEEKKAVICLYQRIFSYKELYYKALKWQQIWPSAWLFVLSLDNIYWDSLKECVKRQGYLRPLNQKYFKKNIKEKFLEN